MIIRILLLSLLLLSISLFSEVEKVYICPLTDDSNSPERARIFADTLDLLLLESSYFQISSVLSVYHILPAVSLSNNETKYSLTISNTVSGTFLTRAIDKSDEKKIYSKMKSFLRAGEKFCWQEAQKNPPESSSPETDFGNILVGLDFSLLFFTQPAIINRLRLVPGIAVTLAYRSGRHKALMYEYSFTYAGRSPSMWDLDYRSKYDVFDEYAGRQLKHTLGLNLMKGIKLRKLELAPALGTFLNIFTFQEIGRNMLYDVYWDDDGQQHYIEPTTTVDQEFIHKYSMYGGSIRLALYFFQINDDAISMLNFYLSGQADLCWEYHYKYFFNHLSIKIGYMIRI